MRLVLIVLWEFWRRLLGLMPWPAFASALLWLFGILAVAATAPCPGGENFTSNDRELVALAEQYRSEIAIFWTGQSLPKWSSPCPISAEVKPHRGGGATSFLFDRGEVFGWRMHLEGQRDAILRSVLPHEVSHTVLASIVRHPVTRWLDEGLAGCFEHDSDHRLYREQAKASAGSAYSCWRRLDSQEYPSDGQALMALYGTGFSVSEYLVARFGSDAVLRFVSDTRPPSAKWSDHFHEAPAETESQWRVWLNRLPVDAPCVTRQSIAKLAVEARYASARPTLYYFNAPFFCMPCVHFGSAYRRDDDFRAAIVSRVNVFEVNPLCRPDLVRRFGVQGYPAFATDDGRVKIVGFTSKEEFLMLLNQQLGSGGEQPTLPPQTPNIEVPTEPGSTQLASEVRELKALVLDLSKREQVPGPKGDKGDPGPEGPQGPPGEDGSGCEDVESELARLRNELRELSQRSITVEFYDEHGRKVASKAYGPGEPIRLQDSPRKVK